MWHAAACHAAEAPSGFVIEQSRVDLTPPLSAEEMQRLAAGTPPRVRACRIIFADAYPGFFTYRCADCGGTTCHRTSPSVQFNFTQNAKFSVAGLVSPTEAEGMRVLRGPDGVIQQMANMKECYFFSQAKEVIVVERYFAFDCETTPDGWMKPLAGAACQTRFEARELAPDPARGIRSFQCQVFSENQGNMTCLEEFQDTKGRVQVVGHNYKGDKIDPETLESQDSLQRVFWKEGPGYRQIVKQEVRSPDGTLQLIEHTITSWRVDKDGSRKLVETQKLVAPPQRTEAEPVH